MQSTEEGGPRTAEIDTQHSVFSVIFAEGGKQVVGGGREGILRRWRVDDGHEVGEPMQTEKAEIYSTTLSPDRKWFACGFRLLSPFEGRPFASVWDAQTHEKVFDLKCHIDTVFSVDISPDSTKLASSGFDQRAFISSVTTGEILVGPLQHEGVVVGIRFSPTGDRIATATAENPEAKSIRIYDSEDGRLLLDIPFRTSLHVSSSLAWSSDGRRLFATSYSEVKCFDTPSGSLLSKWSVPDGWPASIVLSHNHKFAIVGTFKTLSFFDISTQLQIGITIEHASTVWGITLSPDNNCLATGKKMAKSSPEASSTSFQPHT